MKLPTPEETPDWGKLEADVLRKIRLLAAAWEHTERDRPELHALMKRDLYVPLFGLLAEFCQSVHEEDEPEAQP